MLDKGNILISWFRFSRILSKKGKNWKFKNVGLIVAQCNGIAACTHSLRKLNCIAYSIHRIISNCIVLTWLQWWVLTCYVLRVQEIFNIQEILPRKCVLGTCQHGYGNGNIYDFLHVLYEQKYIGTLQFVTRWESLICEKWNVYP